MQYKFDGLVCWGQDTNQNGEEHCIITWLLSLKDIHGAGFTMEQNNAEERSVSFLGSITSCM